MIARYRQCSPSFAPACPAMKKIVSVHVKNLVFNVKMRFLGQKIRRFLSFSKHNRIFILKTAILRERLQKISFFSILAGSFSQEIYLKQVVRNRLIFRT